MPTANELYDQAAACRDQGDKESAVAKLEEAVRSTRIWRSRMACSPRSAPVDPAIADKAILHAKKVVELEPDDAFSYTALSGDLSDVLDGFPKPSTPRRSPGRSKWECREVRHLAGSCDSLPVFAFTPALPRLGSGQRSRALLSRMSMLSVKYSYINSCMIFGGKTTVCSR